MVPNNLPNFSTSRAAGILSEKRDKFTRNGYLLILSYEAHNLNFRATGKNMSRIGITIEKKMCQKMRYFPVFPEVHIFYLHEKTEKKMKKTALNAMLLRFPKHSLFLFQVKNKVSISSNYIRYQSLII